LFSRLTSEERIAFTTRYTELKH